jgi:hypothetical protein
VKRRKTKDDAAWTIPAKQRRRIVRAPHNIGSPAIPLMPATTLPSTWCSRRPGPSRATSKERISRLTEVGVWRDVRRPHSGPHPSRRASGAP